MTQFDIQQIELCVRLDQRDLNIGIPHPQIFGAGGAAEARANHHDMRLAGVAEGQLRRQGSRQTSTCKLQKLRRFNDISALLGSALFDRREECGEIVVFRV